MSYNDKIINEVLEKVDLNEQKIEEIKLGLRDERQDSAKRQWGITDESTLKTYKASDVLEQLDFLKDMIRSVSEIQSQILKELQTSMLSLLDVFKKLNIQGDNIVKQNEESMNSMLSQIKEMVFEKLRKLSYVIAGIVTILTVVPMFLFIPDSDAEKRNEKHHSLLMYLQESDTTGQAKAAIKMYNTNEGFREIVDSTSHAIEIQLAEEKQKTLKELEILTE